MTRLIPITGLAREEWLQQRTKGIGGSDVAAALGLSTWRTPVELWQDKRGEGEPQPATDSMHFGTILEDIVAKEFQERTGMKVQRVGYTFVDGEGDWMRANIDRAVVMPEIQKNVRPAKDPKEGEPLITTDAILECKTASAYASGLWGESQEDEIKAGKIVTEHEIPLYYETQVQWYMRLTGVHVCYVAVLIGGNDFRMYKVDRNEDAINAIVSTLRAFWFDNVLGGKAPEPKDLDDIRHLYRREVGPMVEATPEAAIAIGEYRQLKDKATSIKDQMEAVATKIAGFIGENEGILIGGEKAATFKSQSRATFNAKQLKADDPELWAKYAGRSEPSRILRVF